MVVLGKKTPIIKVNILEKANRKFIKNKFIEGIRNEITYSLL
jgi:hypothetical protein